MTTTNLEIVGEEVVISRGCFRRVRRWVKGWHRDLGKLIAGFTGNETEVEYDTIKASQVITIKVTDEK